MGSKIKQAPLTAGGKGSRWVVKSNKAPLTAGCKGSRWVVKSNKAPLTAGCKGEVVHLGPEDPVDVLIPHLVVVEVHPEVVYDDRGPCFGAPCRYIQDLICRGVLDVQVVSLPKGRSKDLLTIGHRISGTIGQL